MHAQPIGPDLKRPRECEAVLRTLPQWFGIEEALLKYAQDTTTLPSFAFESQGELVAFLSLLQHFPESWEVHCLAVRAAERNQGLGRALLAHAERWLIQKQARFLQVKTLAGTAESAVYAETRAFYLATGFVPIEVFPQLWTPQNPALQLVKTLPHSASCADIQASAS